MQHMSHYQHVGVRQWVREEVTGLETDALRELVLFDKPFKVWPNCREIESDALQMALRTGNLNDFGRIMHEHWQHKKQRSAQMTNADIDRWYALAMEHGAIGGKLIGAGGGGFLLFYTEEKARLRSALRQAGLREVELKFDFEGTKIL